MHRTFDRIAVLVALGFVAGCASWKPAIRQGPDGGVEVAAVNGEPDMTRFGLWARNHPGWATALGAVTALGAGTVAWRVAEGEWWWEEDDGDARAAEVTPAAGSVPAADWWRQYNVHVEGSPGARVTIQEEFVHE